LEHEGYGCVIQTASPADDSLLTFLGTMRRLTERTLSSYDDEWRYLPQRLVSVERTPVASLAPVGTVFVPKGNFSFSVRGVELEGDDGHGVDVQYPWESHPQRNHKHDMEVGPFFMDKYPVTCSNYSVYLAASSYKPKDPYNWIKNWNGSSAPPQELSDVPVTYVSLNEARAYCKWIGARLPHSWEWQYAAQGTDGRVYPWGNEKNQSRFPILHTGSIFGGPEAVTAHAPAGDSPFGVSDLVGNVWQYTDEFQDDHTRAVVVRGGSNYRPSGSHWYFPQALELDTHNKYFLMNDRYERAGTIGFRCVTDAVPELTSLV